MIGRNLQNLLQPAQLLQAQSGAAQTSLSDNRTSLLDRVARQARDYLVRRLKAYAREAEIRKAIEHLQALSDEQLGDIGITRQDITRAVRLGKENI